MTGSHARARRPRELRRTGQRLLSLLPLMLAAQYHSSKFTVRTVGRRGPRDATAKVGRRFFELNRGIEPGEPPFDLRNSEARKFTKSCAVSSATFGTVDIFTPDLAEAHEERSKARKLTLRRPILRRIRSRPQRAGAANVPLVFSFAGCDRSKAV